jgi:chromosome segregation ATPase
MAGSMHFYVCSSGCLSEYYNPKNNTRADSKPEADILTTALDVATAQRDDALAEVRALKIAHQTALEQRNRHGLDAKKAKAEVERLRTALSNADEEIIVLSDQRNDAMAYVTSLKAEAERLKAESKANYRLLKSAVAKRGIDRKERDEYQRLLGVARDAIEIAKNSGMLHFQTYDDLGNALAETGGN